MGCSLHTNVEKSVGYAAAAESAGELLYGIKPWRKVMTAAERRVRRAQRKATEWPRPVDLAAVFRRSCPPRQQFLDSPKQNKLTARLLAFFIRYGFIVVHQW